MLALSGCRSSARAGETEIEERGAIESKETTPAPSNEPQAATYAPVQRWGGTSGTHLQSLKRASQARGFSTKQTSGIATRARYSPDASAEQNGAPSITRQWLSRRSTPSMVMCCLVNSRFKTTAKRVPQSRAAHHENAPDSWLQSPTSEPVPVRRTGHCTAPPDEPDFLQSGSTSVNSARKHSAKHYRSLTVSCRSSRTVDAHRLRAITHNLIWHLHFMPSPANRLEPEP